MVNMNCFESESLVSHSKHDFNEHTRRWLLNVPFAQHNILFAHLSVPFCPALSLEVLRWNNEGPGASNQNRFKNPVSHWCVMFTIGFGGWLRTSMHKQTWDCLEKGWRPWVSVCSVPSRLSARCGGIHLFRQTTCRNLFFFQLDLKVQLWERSGKPHYHVSRECILYWDTFIPCFLFLVLVLEIKMTDWGNANSPWL